MYYAFHKNIKQGANIQRHCASGCPVFESQLNELSRSRPPLSPTLLPAISDLSYHNKGKNAKNRSLKNIYIKQEMFL